MMEWESTSGIFFGVRFGDGGGLALGKPEKGSVLKLNWEGHGIKILIGLGFRWCCLTHSLS